MKKTLATLGTGVFVGILLVIAPTSASAAETPSAVSGCVTRIGGAALDNVRVTFDQPTAAYSLHTDGSGCFSGQVPAGTWVVQYELNNFAPEYYGDSYSLAGAAKVILLDAGTRSGLDIQLSGAATISGLVKSYTGVLLAAAIDLVSDNDGSGAPSRTVDSSAVDGSYLFDDLAPGTYKLHASTSRSDDLVNEWYSHTQSQAAAYVLTISAPGQLTTADFVLQLGGTLNATVADVLGMPVDSSISVQDATESDLDPPINEDTTSGTVSFRGLAPASYTVKANDYLDFFVEAHSAPVSVTVGQVSSTSMTLTPRLPAESDFTDNSPPVSGPTTVKAGGTYTWVVDANADSDVYAILYSSPVLLGAAPLVGGQATLTLTIPATTTPGAHKLTYSSYRTDDNDPQPINRSYFTVQVSAAGSDGTAAGGAGTKELAFSGTNPAVPAGFAFLFLLVGAACIFVQRRMSAS